MNAQRNLTDIEKGICSKFFDLINNAEVDNKFLLCVNVLNALISSMITQVADQNEATVIFNSFGENLHFAMKSRKE